jgi:hypothetical protein
MYIKSTNQLGRIDRVISVNLDPVAIEKINSKGGEGILCRAEDLGTLKLQPNLFMSFEMIEHLTDPVRFLRSLSKSGGCEHLLMTVPYRRRSQFGGIHLRCAIDEMPEQMTAEGVHIFELNPQDWIYLARFAGYRVIFKDVYLQYPKYGLMRIMAPLWRHKDYEGFLALFLERDYTVANKYDSW